MGSHIKDLAASLLQPDEASKTGNCLKSVLFAVHTLISYSVDRNDLFMLSLFYIQFKNGFAFLVHSYSSR